LISLIMSAKGQSRIQAADKNVQLWAAAVDNDWDAKVGPLPGVGDFSERLYGPKLR
jgi:uracil phosphoribosyltransferase